MITGYEMYRGLLASATDSSSFTGYLCDPGKSPFYFASKPRNLLSNFHLLGADVVVVDEAHRIANPQSNISEALKRIATTRRIVLTGYPLQNNLSEYWCMVDFARPHYLGELHEVDFCDVSTCSNLHCSSGTCSRIRSTMVSVQIPNLPMSNWQERGCMYSPSS